MLYVLNPSLIPFLLPVSFISVAQLLETGVLLTSSFEEGVEMLTMEVQGSGLLTALASDLVNVSTVLRTILFPIQTKKKSLAPSLAFLF